MKSSNKGHYGSLSIISILNIIATLCFPILGIGLIGVGLNSDIYFSGIVISQFISLIFSILIINITVPYLSNLMESEITGALAELSSIGFLASLIISIVLLICSGPLLNFLFPSLIEQASNRLNIVFYLSILFIPLNILISILIAGEYSKDSYIRVEYTSLVATSLSIAAILFYSSSLNLILFLQISIARFILIFIFLARRNLLQSFKFFSLSKYKGVFSSSSQYTANLALTKSDPLVDRALISSSEFQSGLLTIYSLSYQFILISSSLIAKVFGNRTLHSLSNKGKDRSQLLKKFQFHFKQLLVVSLVISCSLYFFGDIILAYALTSFKYSIEIVEEVYFYMILLLGLLIGGSLRQLVENLYHSTKFTKQFSWISSLNFCIFLVLKLTLFYFFSAEGICYAISIYAIFDPLILFFVYLSYSKSWQENYA